MPVVPVQRLNGVKYKVVLDWREATTGAKRKRQVGSVYGSEAAAKVAFDEAKAKLKLGGESSVWDGPPGKWTRAVRSRMRSNPSVVSTRTATACSLRIAGLSPCWLRSSCLV